MYLKNFKTRQNDSAIKSKLMQLKDYQNINQNSQQNQILKRFYQTQNLIYGIKQGQKKFSMNKEEIQTKIYLNTTPRNVTPKSKRINQEYYFSKQKKLQTTLRLSEQISKTLQSVFNQPNHKSNEGYSQNKINKTINTDRKYNINSLDSTYLIHKLKTDIQDSQIDSQQNQPPLYCLDNFITRTTKSNVQKPKFTITPFKQAKSLSPTNRALSLLKNNIYYVTSMCNSLRSQNDPMYQIFQEHAMQTFNSIDFCLNQQEKDLGQLKEKIVDWPKKISKFNKTIVFDLDETLIHCNEDHTKQSEILLPITFPSGEIIQAGINVRPWAKEILQKLSEVCEVVIFTASHKCYASQVIEFLDKNKVVSKTLFREHCIVTNEGVHIKDLRILGRDMKDIVLIDNAAYSFGVHIENGIPIIPFYDNKDDKELKQLYDFLITNVLPSFDCRKILYNTFRLREYSNYISPKIAIETLYR